MPSKIKQKKCTVDYGLTDAVFLKLIFGCQGAPGLRQLVSASTF